MKVIRLGHKTSAKEKVVILLVAVAMIMLLHFSEYLPISVGELAEKYHLQIKALTYHDDGVLVREKELTPEESGLLLEQWKEIKLYQPVLGAFSEDVESEIGTWISLQYSGYKDDDEQKEVFGHFTVLETGELSSVRHAFSPKGTKYPELYEKMLEMVK